MKRHTVALAIYHNLFGKGRIFVENRADKGKYAQMLNEVFKQSQVEKIEEAMIEGGVPEEFGLEEIDDANGE